MSYLYDENGHAKYKGDYKESHRYDDLEESSAYVFHSLFEPNPVFYTLTVLSVGMVVGSIVTWLLVNGLK